MEFYSNYNLEYYIYDARDDLFNGCADHYDWKSISEVPDDMVWDKIYEWDEYDRDNFNIAFNHYLNKYGEHGFIIVGTVGRWDGNYDGGKFFKDTTGYYRINPLQDCEYVRFYTDENDILSIDGSHHDGNDHFQIKELTKKGRELYDNWCGDLDDKRTDREIFTLLFNSDEYSTKGDYDKCLS